MLKRKEIIIFGVGHYGLCAFHKLKRMYDILAFADNNEKHIGNKIFDIPVIAPSELIKYKDISDVIIAIKNYTPVVHQINSMGIYEYYIMSEGLLYYSNKETMLKPIELSTISPYKKIDNKEQNVLFVQNYPCIRTNKIAKLIKTTGRKVYLLYTMDMMEKEENDDLKIYDEIYSFSSLDGVFQLVQRSDFDVVHCSNTPEILTNIILHTNKPVVFDTHDMYSIRGVYNVDQLALEHIANTFADGNIYSSDSVCQIAKEKYNITNKPILALENMVMEQCVVDKEYEKLSKKDGEIHCVYEGAIVGNDEYNHRYFELIWKKITDCNIHIHFYSQSDVKYCVKLGESSSYLHYEGNMSSMQLVKEMTKYDCGLAIFNVNETNKIFLETGTANKIYEYLNSKIPVVVGNVNSYIEFVNKYKVGMQLEFDGDIKEQIVRISRLKIQDNILEKYRLTMKSKLPELVEFYEKVIEYHKERRLLNESK